MSPETFYGIVLVNAYGVYQISPNCCKISSNISGHRLKMIINPEINKISASSQKLMT